MGSPWTIAPLMPGELGGIAVVSGSGDYKQVMALKATNLPAIAYHGEKDTTSPNDFLSGKKAALTWYQTKNWVTYPNVAHGADVYAYASNSGLKEWIDSLYPPVSPPIEPIKDPIIETWLEGGKLYFKSQSGIITIR